MLEAYKAQMVLVPAGAFTMGSNDYYNEKPVHQVYLSAYRIGRTEVTVGMWEEFCQATGREMPEAPDFNKGWSKKDHPIVNVSWEEAKAYCDWAGLKLPSEAQWEKAARGTDGRQYPWGNDWDEKRLWCSKAKVGDAGGTYAVGSFPFGASPYGCLDMAGNVWEWCQDYYDASFYASSGATAGDPVNASPDPFKSPVLRGGSWRSYDPGYFRASNRHWNNPYFRYGSHGFRAVASGL